MLSPMQDGKLFLLILYDVSLDSSQWNPHDCKQSTSLKTLKLYTLKAAAFTVYSPDIASRDPALKNAIGFFFPEMPFSTVDTIHECLGITSKISYLYHYYMSTYRSSLRKASFTGKTLTRVNENKLCKIIHFIESNFHRHAAQVLLSVDVVPLVT